MQMTLLLSNFVLKGGRVIDPATRRDGTFDIRIRDGKLDAIGVDLAPDSAAVIDVKDHRHPWVDRRSSPSHERPWSVWR